MRNVRTMTIIKTKKQIKIAASDWEKLKKNPVLSDAIELLEDISDIEKAKKVKGKSLAIDQYIAKRGL